MSGIDDSKACLEENELTDLNTRVMFYIWTNLRPEDPFIRKLDRRL